MRLRRRAESFDQVAVLAQDVRGRLADHITVGDADDARGGLVQVHDAVAGIQGDHPVAHAVEHGPAGNRQEVQQAEGEQGQGEGKSRHRGGE